MDIYRVANIEEGFYGCEECSEEGPMATVTLEGSGGTLTVEVSEERLAKAGIDIGCLAVISAGGKMLKYVRAAAALITDESGRVLAAERKGGEFKDKWEFPGGKLEQGEGSAQAVVREIREELGIEVMPHELIYTVEYDYPLFHLSMDCFICTVVSGSPVLTEHSVLRMLAADELNTVDWMPADRSLIDLLKGYMVKDAK